MNSLTDKIKEILDCADSDIRIEEAATLLLQINRNRVLYENIVRRGNVEKLRYELQKMYDFRIQENAVEETKKLEKKAETILTTTLAKIEEKEKEVKRGRRSDHEELPENIKAKVVENQTLYPRMRKIHEQLKLMANARPCDRYPFLKELKELDEKIRRNWDEYDAYDASADRAIEEQAEQEPAAAVDIKKIQAARKYLSDNKAKLAELSVQEDFNKQMELQKKMQERLDLLIQSHAGISDEQIRELQDLGLHVE